MLRGNRRVLGARAVQVGARGALPVHPERRADDLLDRGEPEGRGKGARAALHPAGGGRHVAGLLGGR